MAAACLVLLCSGVALAEDLRQGRGPRQPVPQFVQAAVADAILGRPTATSIVLSVARYDRDGDAFVRYGSDRFARTSTLPFEQGVPREVALDKLQSNTRYTYEVVDTASGKVLVDGGFHTQRPPGSPFTFTLTADAHLDQNTDTALYQRTLANVQADVPDFHIDLGDTFMTGKHENRDNAARQYVAQRFYFGQTSRSVPLFLVLGNHDGEDSRDLRGGPEGLAVWANGMRKRHFPNPLPDGFYAGNGQPEPGAGLLQDYYAWTWGDALFVVLDPYWHGAPRRGAERWELSLGDPQYQWLKKTLASSRARFKFVFVHQLIGGRDRQGRGGVEALEYGEWGGNNADGSDGFKTHRPHWELPIHRLLVRHGVNAVFHGHDHLYARQERDGVVYQAVPQPGHPGQGLPRFAAEYGYREGAILGGAGHLRVTVATDKATVDFIPTRHGNDGKVPGGGDRTAHSYALPTPR